MLQHITKYVFRFRYVALALICLITSETTLDATEIVIESVQCVSTNDRDTGGDELYLRISPDGSSEFRTNRRNILPGNTHFLNINRNFQRSMRIELWDFDGFPGRDDCIGKFTINANTAPGRYTLRYNREGGHYVLTYRIVGRQGFVLRITGFSALRVTEEDGDEPYFQAKADTSGWQRPPGFFSNIRNGSNHPTSLAFTFDRQVLLKLMEHDGNPGSDDWFGTATIYPRTGNYTALFNRNGSHYVVYYTVSRR